ncbi:unnamed protein product, partial [Polarella glacialis]
ALQYVDQAQQVIFCPRPYEAWDGFAEDDRPWQEADLWIFRLKPRICSGPLQNSGGRRGEDSCPRVEDTCLAIVSNRALPHPPADGRGSGTQQHACPCDHSCLAQARQA